MSPPAASVPLDVVDTLRDTLAPELAEASATFVVAFSGGLDSCVLLHALRFGLGIGGSDRRGGDSDPEDRGSDPDGVGSDPDDAVRGGSDGLVAAHYDHRMRPGSGRDAEWAQGLCRAWAVELARGGVDPGDEAPSSEAEARGRRYGFLADVAARYPRAVVLTAHHADDQAETVLFRVLRGTGVDGLAGIPRRRAARKCDGPPIVRPLLDLWREDLEAYAGRHGLRWREDPTNDQLGYARNLLRHRIIPMAEAEVAPGARRALVRLAAIAAAEETAWGAAMEVVRDAIDASAEAGSTTCDRSALLALGPELGTRVVRSLVADVGHRIDADATRRAFDFVRDSQSGRRIELGRGFELALDGGRVVVTSPDPGGRGGGPGRGGPGGGDR